jgi:serine O-acetyltransferase
MKNIEQIAQQFTELQQHDGVIVHPSRGGGMLTHKAVKEFVKVACELLFPGYLGESLQPSQSLQEYNRSKLQQLHSLLSSLVELAFCFDCTEQRSRCAECDKPAQGERIADQFLEALPRVARLLITDVQAMYRNDPAAKSLSEIIFAYPGIRAIISYRLAHELYLCKVPILPRMIAEIAHTKTGIDIHPGATIGAHFAIDHGTGTVIGETSIIGSNVTMYQGITLGAVKFEVAEDGSLVKDAPRHPIIEDDVTIYSGAKILGRITVGQGSIIGANVWLTQSVAAGSRITRADTLGKFFANK